MPQTIRNIISFINKIFKYTNLKNCILCETWVLFKAPLCKGCRKFLYKEFLKTEFEIKNISNHPCYYLWSWNTKNKRWIQKIIVAMKNGHNFELYRLFMPWLFKKIKAHKNIAYIAAVPSLDRHHPEALLNAYEQIMPNIKKLNVKKNNNLKSQKNKKRKDRLKMSFELIKVQGSRLNLENQGLLILDDVLATGGSFKGMLKLLGDDKICALAVWAYKEPRDAHMRKLYIESMP